MLLLVLALPFTSQPKIGEIPMNTDPLPYIPYQESPGHSTKALRENERSWRELILSHEIESIWQRLAGLTQSQGDTQLEIGDKTQEVFLRLVSEQRLNTYIDKNWSEEQIIRDILSLIERQTDA